MRHPARWAMCLLVLVPAACSPGPARWSRNAAGVEKLFGGIRLGDSQERVLQQARAMRIEVECFPDEVYGTFCPGELEPPPDRPALAFSFRDQRLTSVGRDLAKENEKIPMEVIRAAYVDAFGAPALDGLLNPHLHVVAWASADSSVLGLATCPTRLPSSSCQFAVEETTPDHFAGVIAQFREEMQRAPRTP